MSNHHPPSSSSSSTSSPPPQSSPHTSRGVTSSGREYMNISFLNGEIDKRNLPLAAGSGVHYQHEYVNLPIITSNSGTGMEPGKDSESKIGNGTVVRGKLERRSVTVCEDSDSLPPIPVKQKRSDSHVPTSHTSPQNWNQLPPRRVMECEQCSNLKEQLSLWELGVSGLTRQYSQILAQLNHARDAATILECKMRENWEVEGGEAGREKEKQKEIGGSLKVEQSTESIKAARRKTMLDPVEESQEMSSLTVSQSHPKTSTLADQMYPQSNGETTESGGVGTGGSGDAPGSFPADYDHQLTELSSRLGRAIDLCQQLAVASFKTSSSNVLRKKKNLGRKTSSPLSITPDIPRKQKQGLSWRPLVRVDEGGGAGGERRGVLTRMETEPVLNLDSQNHKDEEEEEKEMREKEKKEKDEKAKKKGKNSSTRTSKISLARSKTRYVPKKDKPSRSSMAGDLFGGGEQETQPVRSHMMSLIAAEEVREKGAGQVGVAEVEPPPVVVGSSGSEEGGELMLSQGSTFSDTDVKQVMTKIALLEDERLKLLETIDQMQNDNQRVRLSLQETVGDLENKDLQLALAMQDLSIATDEIRKVAGLRATLETMESERQQTLEKLSNLEDESAAVKVSLIQLLQEKSATNKTLTLENWRLRQAVRQGDSLSRANSKSGVADEPTLSYMKDDDLANYVHKQGFLVKQGRRVKNWKRRLFVLDSTGLSYYKTEQPIQRVRLADVQAIQVSRNHTVLPHMFEVHTPERTFLLSAPSEDEMQSWVGMLQTLKQYARNPSPPAPTDSGNPVLTTPNGLSVSPDAVLHQLLMENGSVATTTKGRETRSTTFPMTTRSTVRGAEENGAVGVASGEGESPATRREREEELEQIRRPRSQAITMTKEFSLDEAVPQPNRPHSVMISSGPGLRSGELEWTFAGGTETIPEHPSSVDSHSYSRVLSQSHPGTIPAITLET